MGDHDRAAFFAEHGYYILRGAYQGLELEQLRTHAAALRARVEAQPVGGMRFWGADGELRGDHPDVELVRAHSWGVNEITRRELLDPVLVDGLASAEVDALLNELLVAPRAWGLKLLWAPRAATYDLTWHRDCSDRYDQLVSFRPKRNDHVQFNAALEPDRSFIVVPGSHRRPASGAERAQLDAGGTDELPGAIRVELEPGDAVFMDALAIHRGQAEAGAPRLSLHFSCQANWVPLRPWGADGNLAWLTGDEFLSQLHPRTRPYYQRLAEAELMGDEPDPYRWLEERARARGWSPAA